MKQDSGEIVLEVRDVGFRYPDGSVGLDRCSLALRRGSRTVVLGPNGAGKTTLFLHCNGLLRSRCGGNRLHDRQEVRIGKIERMRSSPHGEGAGERRFSDVLVIQKYVRPWRTRHDNTR